MHDAEAPEALDGLGGGHRAAIVGEERARQPAFLNGLSEAVYQRFGGFLQVPLEVTAEPRAIVEDAEELRLLPLARGHDDAARALVEVEVPEAVDVLDLV